jgi:hypothetical protein
MCEAGALMTKVDFVRLGFGFILAVNLSVRASAQGVAQRLGVMHVCGGDACKDVSATEGSDHCLHFSTALNNNNVIQVSVITTHSGTVAFELRGHETKEAKAAGSGCVGLANYTGIDARYVRIVGRPGPPTKPLPTLPNGLYVWNLKVTNETNEAVNFGLGTRFVPLSRRVLQAHATEVYNGSMQDTYFNVSIGAPGKEERFGVDGGTVQHIFRDPQGILTMSP